MFQTEILIFQSYGATPHKYIGPTGSSEITPYSYIYIVGHFIIYSMMHTNLYAIAIPSYRSPF